MLKITITITLLFILAILLGYQNQGLTQDRLI